MNFDVSIVAKSNMAKNELLIYNIFLFFGRVKQMIRKESEDVLNMLLVKLFNDINVNCLYPSFV